MKHITLILLILFAFGFSTSQLHAQSGGRKSEKRVKTKKRGNHILTQYKSRGHADKFARGSGRKGPIARLFKRKRETSWVYKSSGSRKSHYRDNQFLLTRSRTKGKNENAQILDRQNSSRAKSRDRGNKSFRFKKHKSR